MLPWFLLAITLALAYLTYDAFCLREPLGRSRLVDVAAPLSPSWSTKSLAERRSVLRSLSWSPLSLGQLPWAFAVFTLGFAAATLLAFLS
jgi:hypothetical protein